MRTDAMGPGHVRTIKSALHLAISEQPPHPRLTLPERFPWSSGGRGQGQRAPEHQEGRDRGTQVKFSLKGSRYGSERRAGRGDF